VLLVASREALAQRAEDNKLVVTLHCGEGSCVKGGGCRLVKRVLSMVHIPTLTGDTLVVERCPFLPYLGIHGSFLTKCGKKWATFNQ